MKLKITIETEVNVEDRDYPQRITIFEQLVTEATDTDILNVIKAVNRITN